MLEILSSVSKAYNCGLPIDWEKWNLKHRTTQGPFVPGHSHLLFETMNLLI